MSALTPLGQTLPTLTFNGITQPFKPQQSASTVVFCGSTPYEISEGPEAGASGLSVEIEAPQAGRGLAGIISEAVLSPATRPVSEMTAGVNRPVACHSRAVLATSSANASAPPTRYTLLSKSESSVAEPEVEGNAWANVSR